MTRQRNLEYAAELRPRYQSARKSAESAIFDEFCRITRYHRKAATHLPRQAPALETLWTLMNR